MEQIKNLEFKLYRSIENFINNHYTSQFDLYIKMIDFRWNCHISLRANEIHIDNA